MNIIKLLAFWAILSLAVASCYTPRIANKRVTKAQGRYPEVVAENCARFYPVKESTKIETIIKKGDTDTIFTDIYVDCDTVYSTKYQDRIVKVKTPHYIKNNDTIVVEKTVVQESTAKIEALTAKLNAATTDAATLTQKNKTNKHWLWIISSFAFVLLALHVVRSYFKIF